MDILKTLLDDHGPALTSELTSKAGFSADQAKKFVPAAAQQALDKIKGGGFDLKSLLGGGDVSALIGKMDLAGLSKTAGIDAGKAAIGLKAILPMIMKLIQSKGFDANKLTEMLGGGGLGGVAKGIGKMFGKG